MSRTIFIKCSTLQENLKYVYAIHGKTQERRTVETAQAKNVLEYVTMLL
jgi:hypothetical protein